MRALLEVFVGILILKIFIHLFESLPSVVSLPQWSWLSQAGAGSLLRLFLQVPLMGSEAQHLDHPPLCFPGHCQEARAKVWRLVQKLKPKQDVGYTGNDLTPYIVTLALEIFILKYDYLGVKKSESIKVNMKMHVLKKYYAHISKHFVQSNQSLIYTFQECFEIPSHIFKMSYLVLMCSSI